VLQGLDAIQMTTKPNIHYGENEQVRRQANTAFIVYEADDPIMDFFITKNYSPQYA